MDEFERFVNLTGEVVRFNPYRWGYIVEMDADDFQFLLELAGRAFRAQSEKEGEENGR